MKRRWRGRPFLLPVGAAAILKASLLAGTLPPASRTSPDISPRLHAQNRRFEEDHVAQIKAVFPEAYTFRQEKNVPPFSGSLKKGSFQLTVEPSFPPGEGLPELARFGTSQFLLLGLPCVCVCACVCCCRPPDQKESRPLLSASRLLQRRHTFHLNLASIVKNHHKVSGCNAIL